MSLFMCAHGELYSKCKYCSEFEKMEQTEKEQEEDPILSKIVTMMRKEKIEY